jgi:perosamine synthetase
VRTTAQDHEGRRRERRRPRRRIALLGGTTNWGDCLVAIRYLIDPRRVVQGPAIAGYEQAFARRTGVRYAYSFSAGRVGLYGLLLALGIGEGDEVLLQVPTNVVVANAIRYTGATPVYVDCTRDAWNMDLSDLERRITPRAKAIVLQHTFGIPAHLDEARGVARRNGLELIEDCVHALGARYDGQEVGTLGRAAFFSTEETKTISSTMGGVVATDDSELAEKLKAFQESCSWPARSLVARYLIKLVAYHLLTHPSVHRYTRYLYERLGGRNPLPAPTSEPEHRGQRPDGYEQRLSNGQAAVAERQLHRLEENLAHRRRIASAYAEQLSSQGFDLPRVPAKAEAAFVRYPVWVSDRNEAVLRAAPHCVLGTWFTSVLEEAESPELIGYTPGSCPTAEDAADHLVNVPTHMRVTLRDVSAIAAALGQARVQPIASEDQSPAVLAQEPGSSIDAL